jgi:hypothetical protein
MVGAGNDRLTACGGNPGEVAALGSLLSARTKTRALSSKTPTLLTRRSGTPR